MQRLPHREVPPVVWIRLRGLRRRAVCARIRPNSLLPLPDWEVPGRPCPGSVQQLCRQSVDGRPERPNTVPCHPHTLANGIADPRAHAGANADAYGGANGDADCSPYGQSDC